MSALGDAFHSLFVLFGQALAFFYQLVPSYGVAIILLTVAVRLVLLPLTIKQTKSMQEMQKLQPELKKLQAKHKGDRAKLNEETMKLYKEHQVNPLGGCLPLLLQLPMYVILFRVLNGCEKVVNISKKAKRCLAGYQGTKYLPANSALRQAIIHGKAGFLGMNLGQSPMIAYKAHGLTASLPYYVLVFLMMASQYVSQKQLSSNQTGPQAAQMQTMTRIMPVFLGFISLQFPAGVTIYWIATNIFTIAQQRLLLGPMSRAAQAAATGPATQIVSKSGERNGKPSRDGAKPSSPEAGKAKRRPPSSSAPGPAPGPAGKPKGSGAKRRRKPK
jgi:YidC/Oxa1 family membrane protein insertase